MKNAFDILDKRETNCALRTALSLVQRINPVGGRQKHRVAHLPNPLAILHVFYDRHGVVYSRTSSLSFVDDGILEY